MTSAKRGAYQGVSQIVQYNYPYYVLACLMLFSGSMSVALFHSGVWKSVVMMVLWLIGWWMVASLVASYWIYDRSPLWKMNWLSEVLHLKTSYWGLVHSGLDETSAMLRNILPDAKSVVLNLYDRKLMTEPSIRRATAGTLLSPGSVRCRHLALPLRNGSLDAVLLIFSAHELRRNSDRSALFAELARTLHPKGRLVLVEHLRDLQNFCAFGFGFLHFFSRSIWTQLAIRQGLVLNKELKITPFVHVFVWQKEDRCGGNQEGI